MPNPRNRNRSTLQTPNQVTVCEGSVVSELTVPRNPDRGGDSCGAGNDDIVQLIGTMSLLKWRRTLVVVMEETQM